MIELRPAVAADLAAITDLAARCFTAPWSEASFRQELTPPEAGGVRGGRLWVAIGEGQLLGYAVLRRVADELHVLSLAVDREVRRTGLAGRLLQHALAAEPGVSVLHLEVRAGNAGARAFYAAHGFVAVGLRSRYYDDGEDAVLMTRAMPSARRERREGSEEREGSQPDGPLAPPSSGASSR